MSIHDFWPDPTKTPRPQQIKAFDWAVEQFKTKKYVFIESPVGSGKSMLAVSLSNYFQDKSYILTPQRILQKQYENDFARNERLHFAALYGKSNYKCNNKNTNCEIGSAIKPKCQFCPHRSAKEKAIGSHITVMNYDLALNQFAYTDAFEKRKLMVFDECHVLERTLTEFDAIAINYNQMAKMNVKWAQIADLCSARRWAIDVYLKALQQYLDVLEPTVAPLLEGEEHLTPDEINLIKEFEEFTTQRDTLLELELISEEALRQNYVLVHDKLNVTFKRLYAGVSFNRYFNLKADKFLFLSATILNYEGYCKDNGIPAEQAAFMSLDSDFPAENRPVFFMPQMKMTADWNSNENAKGRKNMLAQIERICDLHEHENGIIHTANFKIAEWLVEKLKVPHKIMHHNPDSGDDRNAVIDAFMKSTRPTLLISPSITEGLDLKGDLARFAIIAKTPFPYLGDQWIAARQQLSSEWYRRQALIDVMQGGGRHVRSKDDHGYVYILDESWRYLYSQSEHIIPQWWKDGYHVM